MADGTVSVTPKPPCGTYRAYRAGCPCASCTQVGRQYYRDRRAHLKANPPAPYVPQPAPYAEADLSRERILAAVRRLLDCVDERCGLCNGCIAALETLLHPEPKPVTVARDDPARQYRAPTVSRLMGLAS